MIQVDMPIITILQEFGVPPRIIEQPPVSPSKPKNEEVKPELVVHNKYRSAIVEGDFEFVSIANDSIPCKFCRQFYVFNFFGS